MASLSKKLLDVAKNFLGGLIAGYKEDSKSLAKKTNSDLIGEIYKLIVSIDEKKRLEQNEASARKESQEEEEQERHNEIIKALSVRRKPKKKAVETRKKKKEEKKPGEPSKEEATKKAEQEATKKAEQEAEEKAKQQATDKAKKDAEEKSRQQAADKAKQDAKDKSEREAREVETKKTAEKIKQEEKAPTAEPVKPAEVKPAATKIPKIAIATGAAATGLIPILAKAESPDYNLTVYPNKGKKGIKPPKPLKEMTMKEVLDFQDQLIASGQYPSSAVGKYQIIQGTLKEGIVALKLKMSDTFDEKNQDRLYYEYLTGSKRKPLGDYLTGKIADTPENLASAQMQMAQEFASFGVPRAIKAHEFGIWPKSDLEPGDSFYSGVGGNKASVSPETSARALREERLLRVKPATNVPPSTGAQTSTLSDENKTIKQDMSHSSETNNTFVNNMIPGSSPQTIQKPKDVDDTNPMDRKRNQ